MIRCCGRCDVECSSLRHVMFLILLLFFLLKMFLQKFEYFLLLRRHINEGKVLQTSDYVLVVLRSCCVIAAAEGSSISDTASSSDTG